MSARKDQSRRNVAQMAREMAPKAMEVLRAAMADPDMKVALDASKHVLDRAIGKPVAMTADVTDRLDEFTDDELDAAITSLADRVRSAAEAAGEETPPLITH